MSQYQNELCGPGNPKADCIGVSREVAKIEMRSLSIPRCQDSVGLGFKNWYFHHVPQ